MKRSKGAGTHRVDSPRRHCLLVGLLLLSVGGCSKRLERIESNQVKLENKIDHNAREVSNLNYNMANTQQFLEHKIEQVRRGTEVALAEALAMRYEQERLREQTATFNKKYFAELVRIEEQNRQLHDSVSGVAGGARLINQGVRKLDEGQQTLQANMDENHERVTENQADIRKSVSESMAATETVGGQVAVVKDRQERLTRFVNNANHTMVSKVDGLAEGQRRLQRVSRRHANRLTRQLDDARDELHEGHEQIKALVKQGHDQADGEFATLKAGQDALTDTMRDHHDRTEAISGDVNDMRDRLVDEFSTLSSGQGVLTEQIRDNRDIAMTISSDVNEIGVRANDELLLLKTGQTSLADQLRDNRDIAMTISSDVNDVKVGQDRIYELVQQGTADVDQDQQQIRSTLRDVQETTGTLARDTQVLREAQQQSARLSRRVTALEMGLTEVNSSVVNLQADLTTRMTELTGMMRAYQQTSPDISALMAELNSFSEALRQIQSTQASLSARLDQVSAEAKQQNDTFMSALTELRQQADNNTESETVETPTPQQPEQTQQEDTDTGQVVE